MRVLAFPNHKLMLCYAMHADTSIFRKVYLEYMQKFLTTENGLRAKCQILDTANMDHTQPAR